MDRSPEMPAAAGQCRKPASVRPEVARRRPGSGHRDPLAVFLAIAGAVCLLLMTSRDVFADVPAEVATGNLTIEMRLAELIGREGANRFESLVAADESIQWQAYVPPGYAAAKPPGLLVYISPTQSGEVPRGWDTVLARHNLIWLGANRSGNRELVARRVLLAMLATTAADKYYAIDKQRVFISGFSGGGKTASMIATDYPRMFRGGIYICGAESWDVEVPRYIDEVRRNRFVFITGTFDQALEPTRRVFRAYRSAGIEHSKLIVVRAMTHRTPGSFQFEEAVEFLDAGRAGSARPDRLPETSSEPPPR